MAGSFKQVCKNVPDKLTL